MSDDTDHMSDALEHSQIMLIFTLNVSLEVLIQYIHIK